MRCLDLITAVCIVDTLRAAEMSQLVRCPRFRGSFVHFSTLDGVLIKIIFISGVSL